MLYITPAESEGLQSRKVGQVGPQRSGTLSSYSVVRQIKVPQSRKGGQVGRQRSGTLMTDIIVADIEVPQR